VFIKRGTYKIYGGQTPATLDRVQTNGLGHRGIQKYIYQIEGDTLRTACKDDLQDRPMSFNEGGVWVATYKRVK
jgi:uncharacterized protein (TIGR03067 family)